MDITSLLRMDLSQDDNRLVLSDAMEDLGRIDEAKLLRQRSQPILAHCGKIQTVESVLREIPDSVFARRCYVKYLLEGGQINACQQQRRLVRHRPRKPSPDSVECYRAVSNRRLAFSADHRPVVEISWCPKLCVYVFACAVMLGETPEWRRIVCRSITMDYYKAYRSAYSNFDTQYLVDIGTFSPTNVYIPAKT